SRHRRRGVGHGVESSQFVLGGARKVHCCPGKCGRIAPFLFALQQITGANVLGCLPRGTCTCIRSLHLHSPLTCERSRRRQGDRGDRTFFPEVCQEDARTG